MKMDRLQPRFDTSWRHMSNRPHRCHHPLPLHIKYAHINAFKGFSFLFYLILFYFSGGGEGGGKERGESGGKCTAGNEEVVS